MEQGVIRRYLRLPEGLFPFCRCEGGAGLRVGSVNSVLDASFAPRYVCPPRSTVEMGSTASFRTQNNSLS